MDARPFSPNRAAGTGTGARLSVTQVRFKNLKNRSPASVRAGSRPSAADDREVPAGMIRYVRLDGPASLRSTTCQSMLEKQASTYFARSDGA